jgi:hypothetical protein
MPEGNIIIPSSVDGLDAFHGSWSLRQFKNTLRITAEQAQDMIYPILHKQEIL